MAGTPNIIRNNAAALKEQQHCLQFTGKGRTPTATKCTWYISEEKAAHLDSHEYGYGFGLNLVAHERALLLSFDLLQCRLN